MDHGNTSNREDNVDFEEADEIVINRGCIKFGSSVYQFCNVTGFTIGEFEKDDFPLKDFLIKLALGVVLLPIGIGLIFLVWTYIIYRKHKKIKQVYGLAIQLNSGHKKVFASTEKDFLLKIINAMYKLMSTKSESQIVVDMSNRQVNISGNANGNIVTGDKNKVASGEYA
jgi:hypothetical protein